MTSEIQKSLEILKKGGIILYPTDTIWGIGCDATNFSTVKRIYEIKKREDSKSMLILVDSIDRLYEYVNEVPSIAINLLEVNDKPMTIIYPNAKNLAQNLLAEDGSIGIRVADDEFCKQLIYKLRHPIVSTSANISGENSPKNFSKISETIKQSVDYVVNWRQNEKKEAQPSSIIKLEVNGTFKIIRK